MKKKTKVIVSSALSIALCASMISGATFALFTDTAETNIAVTAGTVDVEANIVDDSLTLYSMEKKQDGRTFENGGKAGFTDAGAVELELVTPGDKAEFDIQVDNDSDVSIKYRVVMSIATEGEVSEGKKPLAEALVVTADMGDAVAQLSKNNLKTEWSDPIVAGTDIADIKMAVELPVDAGNEYQGGSATVTITIEAIQGNGTPVEDSSVTLNGISYDSLEAALAIAPEGSIVKISGAQDLYASAQTSADRNMNNVTIEGVGEASVIFKNVADNNVGGTGSFSDVTLKNLSVVDETYYTGENGENAWEFTYLEFRGSNTFENVKFTDGIMVEEGNSIFNGCTFVGHDNDSSAYGDGTMYGAWVEAGTASFTDCTFTGTRGLKIHEAYGSDVVSVTVDKCNFGPLVEKPGVVIGNVDSTTVISITNSTFTDTQKGDQNKYIYESDTDVSMFHFTETDNVVIQSVSISTAEELLELSGKSLEGTYVLTANIDLNGASIASIAAAYGKTLTINGNGYTISNATLTAGTHNGMQNYGLFYAYTDSTLTINHLNIENVTIDATSDTVRNYGAAVVLGYTDGNSNVILNNVNVKNSHVKNNVAGIGDEAGVYVGYQTGTLTMIDCDSIGCTVAGETAEKTGAMIGCVNGTAKLTDCTTDLTIGVCNRVYGTLTIE